MKPEAQRIAIAEFCGWRSEKSEHPDFEVVWKRGEEYTFALPDYPNDLNAIHEAEKKLTSSQAIRYVDELGRVFTGHTDRAIPYWWYIHAASAQRSEAFLRTIGKWVEE